LICATFVGVDHHWQNVVFGCTFLVDESVASYVWLFKSFLESMGGKSPKSIFTDQDEDIMQAIEQVFPNTTLLFLLAYSEECTVSFRRTKYFTSISKYVYEVYARI
jgi:hypothetical protein